MVSLETEAPLNEYREAASAEPSTAGEYRALLAHVLAPGPMLIKDLGMCAPRPSWMTESLGQFLRDNGFSARAWLGVRRTRDFWKMWNRHFSNVLWTKHS